MNDTTNNNETPIDQFITRWQNTGGKERANYQLFLTVDECVFEHQPMPLGMIGRETPVCS